MKRERNESDYPEGLIEAARRLGWLPPSTEDQVCRAEDNKAAPPLPDALKNPAKVFERDTATGPVVPLFRPADDPDISAGFSRAAREAGHLDPDVEETMRRDREDAEKEADGDNNGQDVR